MRDQSGNTGGCVSEEREPLNRSILAWWKHSSPIERVTLLFRVMACVYAREVTKLTYLLLKPNEPNPNLVPRNDISRSSSARSFASSSSLLWIIIRLDSLEVSLELCLFIVFNSDSFRDETN